MAQLPTAEVIVKGLVEKYDLSSEVSDQLLSCSVGILIGSATLAQDSISHLKEDLNCESEPLDELLSYFEQRFGLKFAS